MRENANTANIYCNSFFFLYESSKKKTKDHRVYLSLTLINREIDRQRGKWILQLKPKWFLVLLKQENPRHLYTVSTWIPPYLTLLDVSAVLLSEDQLNLYNCA